MVEVFFNSKSKTTRDEKKKYKILTFRILESHFKRVMEVLKFKEKPLRQKADDLTKTAVVRNMCEYVNEDKPIEVNPCFKIVFAEDQDRDYFNELLQGLDKSVEKVISTTRSLWFPARPKHDLEGMMYITDEPVVSKYPIYILSKGRSETRFTAKTLDEMNVPYKMVIEPQEFDAYNKYIPADKLILLPTEYLNKNQGGIPARNFIWQHSIDNGHKAHWIIDDNIEGFWRWNKNKKLPLKSGICFKMIEDYFDGCENVAQCGMQYASFFPEISLRKPLYLKNTRIYSCILIKNDIEIEERWRGKYNEDTDLSLRFLKKGYSTLLFQNFLCGKKTTLSVKGGNADIYSGDGLQKKLDSLIAQHPDVVKGTFKFKKVHHQVNYKPFADNKVIYKDLKTFNYPEIKLVKNPKHVEAEDDDDETEE